MKRKLSNGGKDIRLAVIFTRAVHGVCECGDG